MRKVKFFGFGTSKYNSDITGEVWTLNDYYNFPVEEKGTGVLKHVKPTRIYQIHENIEKVEFKHERMKNWKERYNESGAEIVTMVDLGLKNQRIFDLKSGIEQFGKEFFASSFSYMFTDAINENVDVIELIGIDLEAQEEYLYQLPGTIKNIEKARKSGIKVIAPNEERYKKTFISVDWSNIHSSPEPYGMMLKCNEKLKVTVNGI